MSCKRSREELDAEKPAERSVVATFPKRFEGQRVLVTGGSMGIGASIARAFAEEAAQVVVADLVEPENLSCTFFKCDCAVPEQFERCCKEAGPVDILINNVCVQLEAPCHEHSLEDWNKTLSIGLTSYFLFSKYVLPHMMQSKKGVIINIASVQGSQSQPRIPAYAAVKGGVLSLTRQLAVEYAAMGIRVNSVSPGQSPKLQFSFGIGFKQLSSAKGHLKQHMP